MRIWHRCWLILRLLLGLNTPGFAQQGAIRVGIIPYLTPNVLMSLFQHLRQQFDRGYSLLTYVRHLSAQTLKIDQSFIPDMLADPKDLAIAEGVETAEHGTRLLGIGCHLNQGCGIARPMPAGELPGVIENHRAPSVWTLART